MLKAFNDRIAHIAVAVVVALALAGIPATAPIYAAQCAGATGGSCPT
jgi:hypothetical protein